MATGLVSLLSLSLSPELRRRVSNLEQLARAGPAPGAWSRRSVMIQTHDNADLVTWQLTISGSPEAGPEVTRGPRDKARPSVCTGWGPRVCTPCPSGGCDHGNMSHVTITRPFIIWFDIILVICFYQLVLLWLFFYKYSISQLALFFCFVTPASFEKTIKTEHYL